MAKRATARKSKSDDKKADAPADYRKEMEEKLRQREKIKNRKWKLKK